jgi:hypothetical protein
LQCKTHNSCADKFAALLNELCLGWI